MEVGNDEITLRLGKQANKRHLQFALQSLVSVFSKYILVSTSLHFILNNLEKRILDHPSEIERTYYIRKQGTRFY